MSEDLGVDWHVCPAPRNTWVWFRYSTSDPWQAGETCKKSCCIWSNAESYVPGNWWRPMQDHEIEVAKVALEQAREAKRLRYEKLFT